MSSLKENLIKFLFFKIEKSTNPDFANLSTSDLSAIIQIYQYVTNTPLREVANHSCFSAKMKEIIENIDVVTIDELYETIASNVDKIAFIQQLNPVDKDELLSFNINLETGITHENFQKFSEQRLILEMISLKANEVYELDSNNLERVLVELMEIYNKL